MRVGEKETSEQAKIVRRYADLFSRGQLEALHEAEDRASVGERERLFRLRKTCEGGLVANELVERYDELENKLLAARVTFKGEGDAGCSARRRRSSRCCPCHQVARSSATYRPTRAQLSTRTGSTC